MDERVDVEKALGIQRGDAMIFRNAGGFVTADAIRSAMIATRCHGVREIVIVTTTGCGQHLLKAEDIVEQLKQEKIDMDRLKLDPGLPELSLEKGAFEKWLRFSEENPDHDCQQQVEYMKKHPLVPSHVTVTGWVYEVETGRCRKPHARLDHAIQQRRPLHL